MYGGQRRRWDKVWVLVLTLAIGSLATMMIAGCGGGDAATGETDTTMGAVAPTETIPSGGGEGQALGEEILAKFDQLVGEVAALATPKPEPATLKTQLDELYASYEPVMTQLNARYLALRDSDETAFQDCNRYISDNRPQRVSAKDTLLSDPVKYYNFDLGEQEIVVLVSEQPVKLLDIAVNQN